MRIDRGVVGVRGGAGARRRTVAVTMALVLAATAGCFQQRAEPDPNIAAEPVAPTRLRVENQAFLDMTIYVYRGSQRIRLGQASGNSVTRMTIPANLIFGSTPLRFQADPIGGQRAPITQEISVSAGDEVVLTLPPSTR
ncbi:MAG: hypothetical protein JWL60_1500 [Gemmatimonadetes bacterium]|jgi:hypothetical protein|nr:hypothetical protein [Gemmatimonadota bacterium]